MKMNKINGLNLIFRYQILKYKQKKNEFVAFWEPKVGGIGIPNILNSKLYTNFFKKKSIIY